MFSLVLSDLRLILPHILEEKSAVLQSSASGRLYRPKLVAKRDAIEALPPALTEGRPLADLIGQADTNHDGNGAAIYFYTEAVLRAPKTPAHIRDTALRIRDALIPKLSFLRQSYATEAAQAEQNRLRLAEFADDLASFPIPGVDATLATWAEEFVSAGEQIGELLSVRANKSAARASAKSRREAGRLRAETIGLLSRLRSVLADEFEGEPEALARHDAELFTFVDQLAAHREQSLRRRANSSQASVDPSDSETAPANVDPSAAAVS